MDTLRFKRQDDEDEYDRLEQYERLADLFEEEDAAGGDPDEVDDEEDAQPVSEDDEEE
jgi:hypothetical protein